LGYVPVTVLTSRKVRRGEIAPPSEFYSIARTNLRVFNLCSELDEILRNQAFSILIYPGQNNGNARTVAKANAANEMVQPSQQTVSIGTDNMLGFSPDASHPPAFISPPADPADMIMNQIDRLVKEMYRMAVMAFVTGVQEQSSGVAKQWDYEKTNQVLADFASNCEKCERDIARFFSDWMGMKPIEYTVKYPDDFGISDVEQSLTEATQALDMAVGGKFNMEVKKKACSVYLADIPTEDYDAVIADIEQRAADEDMVQTEDNIAASEQDNNQDGTSNSTVVNSAGTAASTSTSADGGTNSNTKAV
jgi:hypothetical protein